MLFRLVRPMMRKGSRNWYFVQRIPADVKARAAGLQLAIPLGPATHHLTIREGATDIRFSLRTPDPSEAKIREAAAAAYMEQVYTTLRQTKPVSLSHRQATALAGEIYRAWAGGEDRERVTAIEHIPGEGWRRVYGIQAGPNEWEAVLRRFDRPNTIGQHTGEGPITERKGFDLDAPGESQEPEPEELEQHLGPLVDRLLLAKGIGRVDATARPVVLFEFWRALRDALESRRRNAAGDYSPDPKAERFPEWQQPQRDQSVDHRRGKRAAVSLTGLVEQWWTEAKSSGRKPSTRQSYRNSMAAFVAFLKHDDAARVSPEDVIGFKDHRLASTHPRTGRRISAKTVKDSDLAGLKTVFGWAVTNRKLPSNPAAGITIKVGRKRKVRSLGFTQEEAEAILRAALTLKPGGAKPWTFAAKRWVPWLMAYSGARVGELAQLRKQDVRQSGTHWVITITPDAGTVKTDMAREIVIHPHLIELGFAEFVATAPAGHLFLRPGRNGDVLGPLQGVKNRLAEFGRSIVKDPHVSPSHGWRHRFETVGMEAEIDHRVLDAIQGHSPRSVAESYGEVTVKTMAEAMGRFPKYDVDRR